ncbi:MAG: Ppx/GppA phosphatase family protein [Phascolarctobacterium sp.]|nr:Ppx/GppA phosphatase family protein [Phascolarctobacterium sp.]
MQRIAIIDIGSNSARLVISHIYKNGAYNMVYNQKEALRLSQKVNEDNMLTEEAFTSTIETMSSFAHMCKIYQADKTIAVATAAIRNSINGGELVEKVAEKTGIQLHIISGKTEAYISYLGVINTLDVKNGIIFDLGGGSTELILFKNRKILESVSIPLGAVNTTELFNIRNEMTSAVYNNLSAFIQDKLAQYPWLKQNGRLPLIGVGGTARTVAKIIQRAKKYPATKIHNYAYPVPIFRNFFNKLRLTNLEQRKKISGLSTERSDIILAGSSIISCLIEATGAKKLITSGCGLREGLFYDYYSKSNNVPLIAKNILERSAENTLNLFETDTTHARHITKLALAMFDGWQELHKVRRNYRRLLETAALLHDIGITINFYSHARHSAYMIQNAKLFGLTHKEQIITSAIAGWHNGVSKNYFKDRFYKEILTESNWKLINKLALLLALAESLDYSEMRMVHNLSTSFNKKLAILSIHADNIPAIEMHQIQHHLSWFKKIMGVELKVELIKEPQDRLHPEEQPEDSALTELLEELDADKPEQAPSEKEEVSSEKMAEEAHSEK